MEWTLGRRRFLAGSAAGSVAALIRPAAFAATETAAPHKHGLNGLHLPMDKAINLTMRVLDGPDRQLQSQRGNVVFMNFFATWCGPCMKETPALVGFAARGLDVVTIAGVDVGESDDKVRHWRKQYAVPYVIGMDQREIFYANIGMRSFPTTLIFRPNGLLSCAFVGEMDADDLENERAYALSAS